MGFWERVTGKLTTYDEPAAPVSAGPETTTESVPAPEAPTQTPDAQRPEPAATRFVEHTVQMGDLISDIAARHGVSPEAVAQANDLTHPDRIYPGMQLRVPAS